MQSVTQLEVQLTCDAAFAQPAVQVAAAFAHVSYAMKGVMHAAPAWNSVPMQTALPGVARQLTSAPTCEVHPSAVASVWL